jgi:murein DD-endopeptidase MepM/ murein hydrolase activator NlpD
LGGVAEDSVIYEDEAVLKAILSDLHNNNPEEWINHVGRFFDSRDAVLSDLPDIWPVVQSELDRITSGFGLRYSPIDNRTHHHEGVDITTSPYNGAVLATAPGVVHGVWRRHPRFGQIVFIEHADGFSTRYAHLSRITVRYQQRVNKGQVIGYIGNSGISDGAHLHYEIRKNGEALDPVKFMLIQR